MSYSSFAGLIAGITVTGVKRKYGAPPPQFGTADMPMLFPKLPVGNAAVDSLGLTTGIRSMTCDVVLVVEPVAQNRPSANYAATLGLMDALDAALRALAASNRVIDRWTLRMIDDFVGDVPCWCIVATVEGSEES